MTGKMVIMDRTGDTTLEWDKTDERSVEETKAEFDRIIGQGMFAYSPVVEAPGKHSQIKEFDPDAETILVRANLVGG